jgi:Tfp pilus assembly protein PilX
MTLTTLHRKIPFTPRRIRAQRGVALVTVLLLLLLLTAISLTMVLSVSSDMLINGYYRNYRGSFYAADSGVNVARQDMINRILAAAPTGAFNPGVQPIPNGTDAQVRAAVKAAYAKPTQVSSAGSWPESFQVVDTAANPTTVTLATCNITGGKIVNGVKPTCANPTQDNANPITNYSYGYNYTVSVVGGSQGTEVATITDSGQLTFNAAITPAGAQKVSFAAWGTFIDQYAPCSAPFVPGTMSGPFFTNGSWNFGDSGQYVFTNAVGSGSPTASYWHGGNCTNVAAASDTNGTTIAPNFKGGFNLGQPAVSLPKSDYNQMQAVLDGKGVASGQPTNAQLNSALRDVTGNPYPSGGTSSGVFVPYTVNAQGQKVFTGGGILVQGDATVKLTPSGASGETYTITQGGVTTTVTTDTTSNTTTISDGTTNTVISGVPQMRDSSTGNVTQNATMLYVNGNITSLSGPGENQTAVNNGVALTVTAAQNVTITGDIRYALEPVTTAQNQIPGTPADTLIPGNDKGQVLGIFTARGDVQMNNQQGSGNLWIDASIAMISDSGTGGWINVGPHINNLNLVGGRIANQAKSGNTTTRNIFFDQRFSQGGFSPPWFPSTTITQGNQAAAQWAVPSVQHAQWLNKTAYQ